MGEPPPPLFLPDFLNDRLWHIPFNRVNDPLVEQLVRGREDVFFGYEFAIQGGQALPDYARRYYIDILKCGRDALRGSFGLYRAWFATVVQNEERKKNRPLTMPALAIGGAHSWGEQTGTGLTPGATDVQTVVLPSAGHWVAEHAPDEMLAAITTFLAPYRDGLAARRAARPRAVAASRSRG